MKRNRMGIVVVIMVMTVTSWAHTALAKAPPSSRISRQAVARQTPDLQKKMAARGFSWGAPLFLRIYKEEEQLELWMKSRGQFKRFKSYPICTYGGKGVGPKTKQGDGRAPEGFYFVTPRQMNPYSSYHLSFNLGYPNRYDRHHGRTGSALMVHGSCVSIGCFAMTDTSIEEIYTLVDAAMRNGQPFVRVHIFPFEMTEEKMKSHKQSPWIKFWRNLKTGHDWFEANNYSPPDVTVSKGRYSYSQAAD